MTVSFTAGNSAVSAQPQDIIIDALIDAGSFAPGEALDANIAAWGLDKLQRLIDRWNAMKEAIFAHSFQQFNITPNHSPHTFGPNGDFNVPYRPVKVISASVILNSGGSNPVDLPVKIRDEDWWSANPLKSLVSSITTDLFYSPDSPLGSCYLWPVSNVNNPVRLETWTSLTQALDLVTPLGMVQGYWDALIKTLAVDMWPGLWPKEPISPSLQQLQREALSVIFSNNTPPPRIDTNSGMPGPAKGGRPDFNFLTGLRE